MWSAEDVQRLRSVVETPSIAGWQGGAPAFAASALPTRPIEIPPKGGVVLVVRPGEAMARE